MPTWICGDDASKVMGTDCSKLRQETNHPHEINKYWRILFPGRVCGNRKTRTSSHHDPYSVLDEVKAVVKSQHQEAPPQNNGV